MRKFLIATVLVLTAVAASSAVAQQKPPAHFPGSKGSRAGEYAARYAAWQRLQPQRLQPMLVSADQPGIPPARRTKEEKPAPTPATVSKDIDDLDVRSAGGSRTSRRRSRISRRTGLIGGSWTALSRPRGA